MALIAAIAVTASCKEVDPLAGTDLGTMGITSVTAAFTGEVYENDPSASFSAQPDENNRIVVEVPYFYPETSDNEVRQELLTNMRVSATLATGTNIEPAVGVMDLTQTHKITAYDAAGRSIEYELTAQITKLSGCVFDSFVVTSDGALYNGIINNGNGTISLMAMVEELPNCTVEYAVSPHATVSGYTEGMTLHEGDKITVTAHNEVDKTEYTITFATPEKIAYGARLGSGRNLWTAYYENMGVPETAPLRLAAQGDYLYVLSGGSAIYSINRKTGEYIGTVSLPEGYTANSMVNDEAGNIIFAADAASGAEFKVYVISSFEDTPRELITYTSSFGAANLGNIRVSGDVTGTAVVTATAAGQGFGGMGVAWQITGGTAGEATRVTLGINSILWSAYNGCIAPATSDLSRGIFGLGYWGNGYYDLYYSSDLSTSSVVLNPNPATDNENPNCISIATFNGARYLAYGLGAHFSYGSCPYFAVYDSSAPASIASAELYTVPYTDLTVGGFKNTGATSDVLIVISEDGYYMDVYFTDGNYDLITCYEFDCIQQ